MNSRSTEKIWMNGLIIGIVLMILLGGYTRLTHAGLSLVDWQPIAGIIPPLNEQVWLAEWKKYQQFPEFQTGVVNDFNTFKHLFWIEYAHRLLGRLIGLWLLTGLIWGVKHWSKSMVRNVFMWTILIGLQGWMGWYMVQSGLIKDPHVSPYRLTIHLWLAISLLTLVVRTRFEAFRAQSIFIWAARLLIGATLTYGGLVAGHKAGLLYNTFPLMGDMWIPGDIWISQLGYWNVFDNPTCVQLIHRMLGITTVLYLTFLAVILRTQHSYIWCVIGWIQAGLGVATLLTNVNLTLALTHQIMGTTLWIVGWVKRK